MDKAVRVRRAANGVSVDGRTVRGGLWVRPRDAATDYVSINGRSYRGVLRLVPIKKGYVDVVEYVDLDDYLQGVLPREVGSNWPMEALKAQAVISRTFALANKTENAGQLYDMSNDVRFQVYGGRSDESLGPTKAVRDTHGEILIDATGKPIQAFFHSSCGGMTEKPGAVWSASYPDTLFTNAEDTFCQEDPYRTWHLSLPISLIRSRLAKNKIYVGALKEIQISKKSSSGRAETLRFIWRGGQKDILGNRFRLAVGPEALRSTLLTEIVRSGKRFDFTGHGWGHGVGLCQWGARGRAAAGETYDQILKVYYPGATLQKSSGH
jgi:stage II sporulation protein D